MASSHVHDALAAAERSADAAVPAPRLDAPSPAEELAPLEPEAEAAGDTPEPFGESDSAIDDDDEVVRLRGAGRVPGPRIVEVEPHDDQREPVRRAPAPPDPLDWELIEMVDRLVEACRRSPSARHRLAEALAPEFLQARSRQPRQSREPRRRKPRRRLGHKIRRLAVTLLDGKSPDE